MKAFLILSFFLLVSVLTMPSLLYPGDNHGIRLAATNLYLHGSVGIDYSERDKLYPYLTNKGQWFIENDLKQKFFSRWGELNTLFFVLPEFFRRPTDLGITPDLALYANGLNLVFIFIATLYLIKLCALFGASARATFFFLACVYYGTFEMTYLRAQTYEVIHLAFFCAYIFHFICYLRKFQLRSLVLAQLYLLLLILSKSTFFTIFASSLVFSVWEFYKTPISEGRTWRAGIMVQLAFLTLGLIVHFGLLYYKMGALKLTSEGGWIPGEPDVFALKHIWPRLKEYVASANGSLFLLFPPFAASLLYWPQFYRRYRQESLLILGATAVTLILLLPFNSRGEACYGPRYFVFLLPVLSLPLLTVSAGRRFDQVVLGVLTIVSLIEFQLHFNFASRPVFTVNQLGSWTKDEGEAGGPVRKLVVEQNYALTIKQLNDYILGRRQSYLPIDRFVHERTDPAIHQADLWELDERLPCNFYFSFLCPRAGWWIY